MNFNLKCKTNSNAVRPLTTSTLSAKQSTNSLNIVVRFITISEVINSLSLL